MNSFKDGKLRYLVATDVAARGIDVENMPLVVHMGIPTQLESYIHRSGRTGRAGAKGASLALVSFKESRILLAWSRRAGLKLDWRAIPSREEIRTARSQRLTDRIRGQEAPAFLALARTLLQDREPALLVAALLSLVEDEAHAGFEIADSPRNDYKTEKRPAFKPRPGEKPGWSPAARDPRPAGLPSRPEESARPRRPWTPEKPAGKPWEMKPNRPARPGDKPFKNK
jgi:ATP-dependent RNA helicase DeaD